MKRKKDDPKTGHQDIKERIDDWLHKTGLPFELATAAAFRAGGFGTNHSALYTDPETGKGREMDVVAWKMSEDALTLVQFIVECKASPNPWIVVLSEDSSRPFPYKGLLGFTSDRIKNSGKLVELIRTPAVIKLTRGGYLLRQAFSGQADPAYDAAISVIKAAKAPFEGKADSGEMYVSIQPIIVVDSRLFECRVRDDGTFELTETKVSSFSFTTHGPKSNGILIRIATRDGLPSLVNDCKEVADHIVKEFAIPLPGDEL